MSLVIGYSLSVLNNNLLSWRTWVWKSWCDATCPAARSCGVHTGSIN